MDRIVELTDRHGAWILADEVYQGAEIGDARTPSFWGRHERVLVTNSLSKAYGLPGLRLGWIVGPEHEVAGLWGRTDYSTICPAAVSDALACVALEPVTRTRIRERTRRIVRENLALLEEWMQDQEGRFRYRPPDAGAICFTHYDAPVSSSDFAEKLRAEKDVLVVPGDHFGMDEYVRIGFGNPADEKQNGHEAVVARNSAIFEEGYLLGSRYLKELKPDIVMGSHSYVMPDPAAFLGRYHDWSKRIIKLYKELLPEKDYEYLFDPYWVSAYPYRVDLSKHNEQQVTVTIRNFRDASQRHRVALKPPPGIRAEPAVLEGTVASESRRGFPIKLTIDRAAARPGLQIVPFDITLNDRHYGQWFDFIIRTTDEN